MVKKKLSAVNAGAAFLGRNVGIAGSESAWAQSSEQSEVIVEGQKSGKPHAGKVFAAVHARAYDVPYYAAGTCAKLIEEGYTGYLVRTTNDEAYGDGHFIENIHTNEKEHLKMAEIIGFTDVLDLSYRSHRMDETSPVEIRNRLIFIFRSLKVDTVLTFSPWGYGKSNPDHWATGRLTEGACMMSGTPGDSPEHMEFDAITPHSVKEIYYFADRENELYNRVVDIGSTVEKKIDALVAIKSQGGGGDHGSQLRKHLSKEGKHLPILGGNDESANREYVRNFIRIDKNKSLGEQYNLKFAEPFYYIDIKNLEETSGIEEYIKKNSVKNNQ
ncbi:hypothetical protein ES708_06492 [subsurface metagenome]